jgi:hypothetical protein
MALPGPQSSTRRIAALTLSPEHGAAAPALAQEISHGFPAGTAKEAFLGAGKRLSARTTGIVGNGPAKKRFPALHVKPAPAPTSSPPCPVAPAHVFRPLNANGPGSPNHRVGRGIAIQADIGRPTKHGQRYELGFLFLQPYREQPPCQESSLTAKGAVASWAGREDFDALSRNDLRRVFVLSSRHRSLTRARCPAIDQALGRHFPT